MRQIAKKKKNDRTQRTNIMKGKRKEKKTKSNSIS